MNVNKGYFNNTCRVMTSFKNQQGMSLLSMLIGIGISTFLLLMIAQLSSIAKQNYIQTQNMIGLYDNAREAIQFLRTNIAMAGYGIMQPKTQNGNIYISSEFPAPAPGGYAVLPDWVYIGLFNEPNHVRFFSNGVSGVTWPTTGQLQNGPAACSSTMNSNYNNIQFFGLQFCSECWAPNVGFNKQNLASYFSPDTDSLINSSPYNDNPPYNVCCIPRPPVTSCWSFSSSLCGPVGYGCGGPWRNSVYQKLMRHVCLLGEGHPFNSCSWQGINLPAAGSVSGDALAVVFSNPGANPIASPSGSATMTSFSGQAIPVATSQPPSSFNYYTFYVNNANNILQAIDSISGTTYNIANNVEFMAVMVGENDLIVENYLDPSSGKYFDLPQLNRYVSPSTTDLYPYRIIAIRVGIVVRTQDPMQFVSTTGPPQPIGVMLGNNGVLIQYTPPNDGRLRKAFVTTIFLNNYTLPDYQAHCTGAGGSNYYAEPTNTGSVYYLKIGGIPFSTTWDMNHDRCVNNDKGATSSGGNCTPITWNACEIRRMQGG